MKKAMNVCEDCGKGFYVQPRSRKRYCLKCAAKPEHVGGRPPKSPKAGVLIRSK